MMTMGRESRSNRVSFGGGKSYALDTQGFLDPSGQWDEAFAKGMAVKQGIYNGLTDEHWRIIRYLRKKFLEEKTVPFTVIACMDNKIRLGTLRRLFPTGFHRGACRIAGINYKFICEVNFLLTYESDVAPASVHELTPAGFLRDFEKWDKRFAGLVAREWDLPDGLTERHWGFIEYLRDRYADTGSVPTVYEACNSNSLELGELKQLFPEGYRRGACRIAGLPFFS